MISYGIFLTGKPGKPERHDSVNFPTARLRGYMSSSAVIPIAVAVISLDTAAMSATATATTAATVAAF